MTPGKALAVVGLTAGLFIFLSRRAFATPFYEAPLERYYGEPPPAPAPTQPGSLFDFLDYTEPYEMTPTFDPAQTNLTAFLAVIRSGEGTIGPDGYRTLFGGGKWWDNDFNAAGVADMGGHPGNLGWPGIVLSDAMCAAAGFGPGCVSKAAGAYQFLPATWNEAVAALGLPDFSPASQDAAAIFLIQRRGALVDVQQGNFESAIKKVAREWASMPFSPYGQPVISMATAQNIYLGAGGFIA